VARKYLQMGVKYETKSCSATTSGIDNWSYWGVLSGSTALRDARGKDIHEDAHAPNVAAVTKLLPS
jgi:hypothetical protein